MPHATGGVTKVIRRYGNGVDRPRVGDTISMHYTGCLYDPGSPATGFRSKPFDSSHDRGEFTVQIGMGRVIRGWDDGVVRVDGGMSLGEEATLRISSDFGYGPNGFPGLIPRNAELIFDVELLSINGKRAQ